MLSARSWWVRACHFVGLLFVGEAQEQVGQAGGDAFEGHVFEAFFGLLQALAGNFENAQGDLGLAEDEPFKVVAAHDTDQAVVNSFGKGIVHLCAQQGHLAEECVGAKGCDDQFFCLQG